MIPMNPMGITLILFTPILFTTHCLNKYTTGHRVKYTMGQDNNMAVNFAISLEVDKGIGFITAKMAAIF